MIEVAPIVAILFRGVEAVKMATEILIPEATVDHHAIRTVAVVHVHVVVLIVTVVNTVLDHVRVAVRIVRGILDQGPIPEVIVAVHEVHGTVANDGPLAIAIIRSRIDASAFLDSAFTLANVKFAIYSPSTELWKAFK